MKKIMSTVLGILLTLSLFVPALAAESSMVDKVTTETIMMEDGGIINITTTIYQEGILRGVARKSASKKYSYRIGSRNLWTYTLYATFDSDGTATDAYDDYTIYDDNWDMDSSDTYTSGNTAYGEATFSSGSTRKYADLSLTCDRDGNID